ncbi:MAG TPA: 5-methyltetrahydropteroyltriglutamate--homocysteine S-methyltransferase [Stellaceae bacterium]|jgi:5-methyltetrahydropteroyltriglutamate--homocysteine methyltransferase|nr:5-methyltetrahydropteroyltriglutamate--homocysteine S-methyltransferase [Stellaceae bacterium]
MAESGEAKINPPFRADHVGSLLRSPPLLDARKARAEGKGSGEALRALEDQEILGVIALQERVGLQAITDGEFRRSNWRDRFFERVEGYSQDKIPSSFSFTEFSGEQRRGMPVRYTVGKLKQRESITADDFAFVRAHTKRMAKATIPSPTVNHFFTGDAGLAKSPYAGDRKTYMADIAAIYRDEIAALAKLGCKYLQVDEVPLAVLCDPKNQDVVRGRGEEPQKLIDDYIDLMNAAIRDRPAGMTLCVHLCRGNAGHGQASGGYDPVAERLFQKLDVDGFFLEYDTPRAGDFQPLRHVPKNKIVVLGLMSTKQKALEPIDELKRRVAEAARYVDMDRLCLSPQCGFASSAEVDRFTVDDEERKLAHLVRAADEIWR